MRSAPSRSPPVRAHPVLSCPSLPPPQKARLAGSEEERAKEELAEAEAKLGELEVRSRLAKWSRRVPVPPEPPPTPALSSLHHCRNVPCF